jgi:hypothetical protein
VSALSECPFGSPESETCGMCISLMSGNREISEEAAYSPDDSPVGEGQGRNPGAYTSEKSDRPIVPEKPSNKAPSSIAICPRGGGDGGGKGPDRGEPVKVRQVPYTVTEA